jgi:hypothetical protein
MAVASVESRILGLRASLRPSGDATCRPVDWQTDWQDRFSQSALRCDRGCCRCGIADPAEMAAQGDKPPTEQQRRPVVNEGRSDAVAGSDPVVSPGVALALYGGLP